MALKSRLRAIMQKPRRCAAAILLIVVGAAVLLLPDIAAPPAPESSPAPAREETMEQRLEKILSQVEGAGSVRVMLTTKNDGVTVFQTDSEISHQENATQTKSQTVFYKNGASGETALVQSLTAPEYLGAVVVCEGAERAEVRLQLVRAVCALTGLTGNKISVLKMKG